MKLMKIVIILSFMGASYLGMAFLQKPQKAPLAPSLALTTMQPLFEKIKQEEERIWQAFEKIGIEKKSILKTLDESIPEYHKIHLDEHFKDYRAVSQNIEKTVREILKKIPANTNYIRILQTGCEKIYCAAATGNLILINEEVWNQLSPESCKFIIAHEATHIVNHDTILNTLLEETLGKNVKELGQEDKNHPLCQLSRLQEWRADIGACSYDNEFKKYYESFCKEVSKNKRSDKGITHPTLAQRTQLAQSFNQPHTALSANLLFA